MISYIKEALQEIRQSSCSVHYILFSSPISSLFHNSETCENYGNNIKTYEKTEKLFIYKTNRQTSKENDIADYGMNIEAPVRNCRQDL